MTEHFDCPECGFRSYGNNGRCLLKHDGGMVAGFDMHNAREGAEALTGFAPFTETRITAEGTVPSLTVNPDIRQVGGDHYKRHTLQPWDAMREWMPAAEFRGFLWGNVIKYVARWMHKGGLEDLEKARHYLDKLIESERARLNQ